MIPLVRFVSANCATAEVDHPLLSCCRRNWEDSVASPGRPGEAARIARKLAERRVNIDTVLSISICGGGVVLTICVDQPDDARRVSAINSSAKPQACGPRPGVGPWGRATHGRRVACRCDAQRPCAAMCLTTYYIA